MLRIDERTRPWWTLAGACFGLFILMLDSTVVALALPSIRHDVGASAAGLQWVMNGYLLVITAFVITAGQARRPVRAQAAVPHRHGPVRASARWSPARPETS